MKMGSAGLNNLILLDQVKGHCDIIHVIVDLGAMGRENWYPSLSTHQHFLV